MPKTYHQIYIHAVFAVKYRAAVIEPEWSQHLFHMIARFINETGARVAIVNGVYDHVHCLFSVKTTHSVAKIMQYAKGKSSKWLNEQSFLEHYFEWQQGYGAFSCSADRIKNVYRYIENQEIHHQQMTFKEEFISFLDKNFIDYEEQSIPNDLM
ncbi:MAG: hypothetical protein RL757_940 [Bacteroidota bacterium]|jgi:REP element-mobilizing transposase RayT